MPSLPPLPHLSVQLWAAAAAVGFLLALLLGIRLGRRSSMVHDERRAELIAYHLGRIADAIQQSPLLREAPPSPSQEPLRRTEFSRAPESPQSEAPTSSRVSLSMFGR